MDYPYITQAEFQAEFPEVDVSPFSAATISGMIASASEYIDNFCNVDGFIQRTVTGQKSKTIITNEGDLMVFPRRCPITDVSAASLKRGTLSIALTLTSGGNPVWEIPDPGQYWVYPNTFMANLGTFTLYDLREIRGYSTYTVLTYTGGYPAASLPRNIKKACMLLVRDQMTRRLNVAGASEVQQGGIRIKYSSRDDGKSDNTQDAENLLQEYVRRVPV